MSSNELLDKGSATHASYNSMPADVLAEPDGIEGNVFHCWLAFSVVSLGNFLFGFWRGACSEIVTACQLLYDETCDCTVGTFLSLGYSQCYALDDWQQGYLTCLPFFGAMVSSAVCTNTGDYFSRILEVKVCAGLYLFGGLCASLSPNLLGIVIGLFLYGGGIGVSFHAAPLYLAEITTDKLRAQFVAAKGIVVIVGVLVGYTVGWFSDYKSGYGWRLLMVVVIVIAIATIVLLTVYIPRSPCWLVLQTLLRPEEAKAYMAEAKASLEFFRSGPPSSVDAELAYIEKSVLKESMPGSNESILSKYNKHLKSVVTVWVLAMLMQLSGTPTIDVESTNIFEVAGWSLNKARIFSACNGLTKLFGTTFAVVTVARFGTRFLLLCGTVVAFVAYLMMIYAFTEVSCSEESTSIWDCDVDYIVASDVASYLVVVGVLVNSFGFQMGFGPLIWLVAVEILPFEIRSKGLSMMEILFFACYCLAVLFVDTIFTGLTMWGTWVMFACEIVGAFTFIWFLMPKKKPMK